MTDKVLQSAYVAADRVMLVTSALIALICVAIGASAGAAAIALLVGVPAVAVPFAIHRMAAGSLVSRFGCAASFMVLAALMIQVTGGLIEAHFIFRQVISIFFMKL